jgi:hypothetical protein
MKIPSIIHPHKPKKGIVPHGHYLYECYDQVGMAAIEVDGLGNYVASEDVEVHYMNNNYIECDICGVLDMDQFLEHGLNSDPQQIF